MPERRAGECARVRGRHGRPVLRRERGPAAGAAMVDRCGSRLQDVGRPARQADIPRCRRPSFFLSPPSLQSSDHPLHRDRSWINVHYGFVPFLLLFAVGREAAAMCLLLGLLLGRIAVLPTQMRPIVTDRVAWSVSWSVCRSVGSVCHTSQPYKTAAPIEMPFRLRTRVGYGHLCKND